MPVHNFFLGALLEQVGNEAFLFNCGINKIIDRFRSSLLVISNTNNNLCKSWLSPSLPKNKFRSILRINHSIEYPKHTCNLQKRN